MKDHLDYILFAVVQAKEAEAFGFTRNECCRNLKTALHQYWQNKTLGQHSQAQKAKIPRSQSAMGRPLSDLVVEHVVPQMLIVNMLMDMVAIDKGKVKTLLKKYLQVLLVTKDEHNKLNSSGLRSTMPMDWDAENVWARYDAVGIQRTDD